MTAGPAAARRPDGPRPVTTAAASVVAAVVIALNLFLLAGLVV